MAWIQPDGVVFLYKNVPLLPNHHDTVYFTSQVEKDTFFDRYYYKSYANISYQRVGKNKIRLEGSAEDMYFVNYMSFINNGFNETPKMWYAFVDECEYINNNVYELTYHIDVMVTWATEMVLEACYVEREHSATDNVGDNLVAEPVETGDYILQDRVRFGVDQMNTILCLTPVSAFESGRLLNGVFNQMIYYAYELGPWVSSADRMTAIHQLTNAMWTLGVINMKERIVSLFMFPRDLSRSVSQAYADITGINEQGETETNLLSGYNVMAQGDAAELYGYVERPDSFKSAAIQNSTYTPKNKKLLTYPYMYACANTFSGHEDYKFEEFHGVLSPNQKVKAEFSLFGFLVAKPRMVLVPRNYQGEARNINKVVVDSNFPELPVYSNSFIKLVGDGGIMDGLLKLSGAMAQNDIVKMKDTKGTKTTTTKKSGEQIRTTPKGRQMKWTEDSKTTKRVTNTEHTKEQTYTPLKAILPDIISEVSIGDDYSFTRKDGADVLSVVYYNYACKVMSRNGDSSVPTVVQRTYGLRDVYLDAMGITAEQAKVIDDFFSYYGYATNKIKVPYRHSRDRWTFVQTTGCKVHGDIDADSLNEIAQIFDDGITFWDMNATVGQYINPQTGNIYDNAPLGNSAT